MAWLVINGIDASGIVANSQAPQGDRREIGNVGQAASGRMSITRQSRKYDLTFKSVPLTGAEANTWEQFICGLGRCWSFEGYPTQGLYEPKGLGPETGYSASIVDAAHGATPKFDDCVLRLPATSGTVTFHALPTQDFEALSDWTFMIWRLESGTWHHYIQRSEGTVWKDGVLSGADMTGWFDPGTPGFIKLMNTGGSAQDYDEMVVFPFKILDSWPPIFANIDGNGRVSFLPFVALTGDVLRERSPSSQLPRVCYGTVTDQIAQAKLEGSLARDARVLNVTLKQI